MKSPWTARESPRAHPTGDRPRILFAVSEIVRGYIEERFQVWAAHRTTDEFLHDLLEPSDALLAGHRVLLADFLQHCDLAKFARWNLPVEEMENMLWSARASCSNPPSRRTKPARCARHAVYRLTKAQPPWLCPLSSQAAVNKNL